MISACKKIMQCSTADLSGNFDKVKITKTKKGDTHPSLKDRVDHLGVKLTLPKRVQQKDLSIFSLGRKLKSYLEQSDKEWIDDNLYRWQSYHQYMSDNVMRRDLLVKTKLTRPLLNGEMFELARLEEVVGSTSQAIKRYYETYQQQKRNFSALYEAARLMLKINTEKAEPIINKLMNRCPVTRYNGAYLLSRHFDRINNDEKAQDYKKISEQAEKALEIRYKAPKKNLLKHGLSKEDLKQVVQWLEYFGDIYWAMLFQLKPEAGGWEGYPNYILIVATDNYLYDGEGERLLGGLYLNGTVKLIDEEYDEKLVTYVEEYYKEAIIFGESNF